VNEKMLERMKRELAEREQQWKRFPAVAIGIIAGLQLVGYFVCRLILREAYGSWLALMLLVASALGVWIGASTSQAQIKENRERIANHENNGRRM
jgi:uncharacterized membrane protein